MLFGDSISYHHSRIPPHHSPVCPHEFMVNVEPLNPHVCICLLVYLFDLRLCHAKNNSTGYLYCNCLIISFPTWLKELFIPRPSEKN